MQPADFKLSPEAQSFHSVFQRELRERIRARREAARRETGPGFAESAGSSRRSDVPPDARADHADEYGLIGLALSGGGIRSACFNLGVLQALGKARLLRCCDYLSTVSGGGYIGCCLTSLLTYPKSALDGADFPFSFDGQVERPEVSRLRDHRSYLAQKHGLFSRGTWQLISSYVVGLIANMGMVFLTLGLVTGLGIYLAARYVMWMRSSALAGVLDFFRVGYEGAASTVRSEFHILLIPGEISLVVWGAIGVVYLLVPARYWTTARRRMLVRWGGWYMLASAIVLALASLSPLFHLVQPLLTRGENLHRVVLPTYLTALAATVLPILKSRPILDRAKSVFAPIALTVVAALFAILFVLGIAYLSWTLKEDPRYLVAEAVAIGVLGLLINVNRASPFFIYRDRLSDAFLFRGVCGKYGFDRTDKLLLSEVRPGTCPPESLGHPAPYPLINATVNVPSSRNHELHGLPADFFLFSPLHCGSRVTGYLPTEKYNGNRVTLGDAMAISGAAANPQLGFKTNSFLAFILAVFNARLGLWIPNPGTNRPPNKSSGRFWPFYLWQELFSTASERHDCVNVSDGGHVDNLGIYELLRRRCRTIIVSDATADAGYRFDDLANVMRRARIDLGVQIRLQTAGLEPTRRTGRSRTHFVVGDIVYPVVDGPDVMGRILYIKSTITDSDPDDLRRYHQAHPAFPHDPTFNQFFDETQFESYRELGYRAAKALGEYLENGTPLCPELG